VLCFAPLLEGLIGRAFLFAALKKTWSGPSGHCCAALGHLDQWA